MPKLHEVMGGGDKCFLSRHGGWETHPCSAADRRIESDWGPKSSKSTGVFGEKKVVFRSNLKQMFKRRGTDLDTQLTSKQPENDVCAQ